MSPVYNPPREKISRFTLANLAFLVMNAVVAAALVYGLWRTGRFFVAPPAESALATRDSGNSSGDEGAGSGEAPSSRPGSKAEPGTAVYYSKAADYNPTTAGSGGAAGSNAGGRGGASPTEARGSSRASPAAPGTATYSVSSPHGPAGAPRGSTPGAPGSSASATGQAAAPANTAGSVPPAGAGLRDPRDTFTTTGRTTPGTSAPPPIRTPTTPGNSAPPPSPPPETDEDDPPQEDDPPVESEPGSDRTPPVLDSIVFDPAQVADGGSTILYIHAHDDLSGVRSVTGTIKSPTGGALFSFSANDDGSGRNFAARVSVPPKAESGSWYVANLYIADRVDNTLVLGYTPGNVPGSGRLSVVSSQSDTSAPTLVAIDLEHGSVRGGETERVRLTVTDDISGVASIVGTFQSPTRSAGMTFTARPLGEDSSSWVADLAIPTNADCGEWRMSSLRMTDRAGNAAALGADASQLSRVSFGVVTDGCDSSAPYLESLSIAPSVVSNEAAAVVTITAVARDDGSGVSQASGWVGGPVSAGGETPKLSFTCARTSASDPDAPWTCRVPVPQFAARGTWHMGRMRLTDRAGNVHDYMPDDNLMEGATFDVQ